MSIHHYTIFPILFFPILVSPQFRSPVFSYSTPLNCTYNQYYNRFELKCELCPNSTIPSSNKMECLCPKGQIRTAVITQISQCQNCSDGYVASPDQTNCIRCQNDTCECSNTNFLIYRDFAGNILTNGGYCSECATGYSINHNKGYCNKCDGPMCPCENCTTNDMVYSMVKLQSGIESRSSFIEHRLLLAYQHCLKKNIQSCEVLVNLCVLQNYEYSATNARGLLETIKRSYNPWQNSLDPILMTESGELDRESAIDHQYKFESTSYLDITFARFDINGTFEGFYSSDQIHLHFCGPDVNPTFPFLFGRRYYRSCQFHKNTYYDNNMKGKLFEMYLKYLDGQNIMRMYPLHILNSAIRINDQLVNTEEKNRNRWSLTRRFFLYDDYSILFENSTVLYRFATKISLNIELQQGKDGYINPPYLIIEYDDTTQDILSFEMEVIYHKDPSNYDQKLVIFLSVLIPLSAFWAVICAYSWGRRMGKPSAVDASSIIYFFVCEVSILGDVFFIMFSIVAIWVTFAYKSQTYVFYNMLSNQQESSLFHFIIAALVLKFFGLIFTMGQLIFQETFFIDWERQKLRQTDEHGEPLSRNLAKSSEAEPVVVWRTYMIANEWNELQQYRKTSLSLQLIIMILLIDYFNYINYALVEPGFSRNDIDSSTIRSTTVSTMAVTVAIYLFVALCQVIGQVIIVERIITDPFHNFIDLCSVSNISVLSLTHSLYGYYIHGRSVHGKGDAGMSEMNTFLQRERDNLCGDRGLEPSSELQTFTVNLPYLFRTKYDEIMTISRQTTTGVAGHDAYTAKMNSTVEAHTQMNTFLKTFVDHSINEIDYTVRDKTLIESILDTEMSDSSINGTFTRDPSEISYASCFVYGNEWNWCSFECLTVVVFFIWSGSIQLSCFIAYIISNILRLLFSYLSTNHLIKTSLVDQRFLC